MPEAFSFNREFDFVRLDGLRRATGRPPHEWDIYIVKELIDNALDADEARWRKDPAQFPSVRISMEYIRLSGPPFRQLYIQVSNRAKFPVEQIEDIFATKWYTSRKAFMKGITRGALGNALKTLLGIPYAIRNRGDETWTTDHTGLKPLTIHCDETEHVLRYIVDAPSQTISLEYEKEKDIFTEGTVISVGVEGFIQEVPRELKDIQLLAEQYHMCNPHARFHWSVEINNEEWLKEYTPDAGWSGKFRDIAPIQWYSLTAFQDVLGALYRKQYAGTGIPHLSVETVCRFFAGFEKKTTGDSASASIIQTIRQSSLTAADIKAPVARRLYEALCQYSPGFDSPELGRIGLEQIRAVLCQALPVEGEVLYDITTDAGEDPSVPFVIEAAIVHLKDEKRQVWTAINFSPTYGDPFRSRWLSAPVQPDEPVLGLRGLLDAYQLREETPVVLFLHLICPNVEHHEFSKTEINHLPFKQAVGAMLDRLLKAYKHMRKEEELRLEQTIFQALDTILNELDKGERFVFEQLVEKLRIRLSQEQAVAAWLDSPDSMIRLQAYIASYQSRNTVVSQIIARPAVGTLDIPLHPDRHFSVFTEYISRELLAQHYVNKLLYVQPRELEPVVVENGWLCSMDMALLRNPPRLDDLQDAVVQCIISSDLPLLVLHNADEDGSAVVEQMRTWLEKLDLDRSRIVDLGLHRVNGAHTTMRATKLAAMMPGELATWLLERFSALDIPVKSLPLDPDIQQDISKQFDQSLHRYLLDGMSHMFEMAQLLIDLYQQLLIADAMTDQALNERLKEKLTQEARTQSYAAVRDEVADEFFKDFMREHSADIQQLVQAHTARLQGGGNR